jgi:hypothetical protein
MGTGMANVLVHRLAGNSQVLSSATSAQLHRESGEDDAFEAAESQGQQRTFHEDRKTAQVITIPFHSQLISPTVI